MAIRNSEFKVADYTSAINKVPRVWSLVASMDMFEEYRQETDIAKLDVVQEKSNLFEDRRRGAARNYVESESVTTETFMIPFFPLDGKIRPVDLQGLREWGTANEPASVDRHIQRIMERMRRSHGQLKEKILVEAIKGSSYSPNSTTPQYNYYTQFGQTQQVVNFDFANSSTQVLEKTEAVRDHIIDNAQDQQGGYEIVGLCSTTFFNGLLTNDEFQNAYTYFQNPAINPLRDRVGGESNSREFVHQGIRFIEYKGQANGTDHIPAGDAYFFPMGIPDMFSLHYAPADLIDYVNTPGQDMYMLMKRDDRKVVVESETSMLGVNTRPELVVRGTLS